MGDAVVAIVFSVPCPALDHVDDVGPARYGSTWKSAAEDLCKRREIGPYPEVLLGAAFRDSEPGYDLIEDEYDTVALSHLAQLGEELGQDGLQTHVGAGGLKDDCRNVVVFLERLLEQFDVVRGKHDHRAKRLLWDAAESLRACDQIVTPAVEVVLELNDLGLTCIGAGHPDRHHVGFGAGAVEADLLRRRNKLSDPVAPLDLHLGRAGEVGAHGHLVLNGLNDLGARVAEYQCAVTWEVVEYAVAIHVILCRAFSVGVIELERVLAAGIVGYPVGKQSPGIVVQLSRLGVKVIESALNLGRHWVSPPDPWLGIPLR